MDKNTYRDGNPIYENQPELREFKKLVDALHELDSEKFFVEESNDEELGCDTVIVQLQDDKYEGVTLVFFDRTFDYHAEVDWSQTSKPNIYEQGDWRKLIKWGKEELIEYLDALIKVYYHDKLK